MVQHAHEVPNHIEIRLGHLEPEVERVDEVRPDLLAGHAAEVVERLEDDLMSASVPAFR